MLGDRNKLLAWEPTKKGNVTFGNNAPGKIVGKGVVSLPSGKGKAKNVLFVDGLKHNLLRWYHMCDQGYDVIFKAKNCQIKSLGIGKVIAKDVRIDSNVYCLKYKTKRCFLSKIDEIWAWYRRLGHLNFDQIVKLGKKNSIKDLPKLSKHENAIYRSFQLGKKA